MGKSQMSMREPIKLPTTFLVFFPNHLFLPECGWVSYCMEGEEYGQPNSNWAETHFWKTCSDFLGKKNAQKRMPFCHAFTFFSFLTFLGAARVFPVSFIHDFGCWLHSFHGWEVVFVVLGTGLFSPRFWAAGAFSHSRFLWIHVFLPWLGRAIPIFYCLSDYCPHAQAIWDVFPCCELCSQISFRTVRFSPTLWVVFAVMYGVV